MHTMESHVSAPVFGAGSQFMLMEVNSAGGKEAEIYQMVHGG